MDNLTFGVSMIVVGMGGTLLTLWILSLLMILLKRIFPYKTENEGKKE
ncbi:MAG TPA: OadG-related small transporter subunit [Desulfatiglandales bacterium]|nr:OadG-related small transporter subunit [Desulfatiglandales bacterium]